MAAPLAVSHDEIERELRSVIALLNIQLSHLESGRIIRAEDNVMEDPRGLDPDSVLRRFQREIEYAGQKLVTLASAIDPEGA